MKKILIVIGNAGAGHMSCANTTKEAILKKFPNAKVTIFDMYSLSRITKTYNFFYYVISRSIIAESIYNFFYKLIDKYTWYANFSRILTVRPLRNLNKEFLEKYKPDTIICNNALTVTVIDDYCERFGKTFKYYITVPDLVTVSRWWASGHADMIFCPTKECVRRLKVFNREVRTKCCYYPLRRIVPMSSREVASTKRGIFKEIGFDLSKQSVLVTGCGFATGNIIAKMHLFIWKSNYQFIILTGNDHILKKALELEFEGRRNVYISGFTDRIIDLMEVSDIVISKPGPATLLEIERLNKRAIFTKAIGYQEYGNVDYLSKNPNFLYIGSKYRQIPNQLRCLLERDLKSYKSDIKDINSIVESIQEW